MKKFIIGLLLLGFITNCKQKDTSISFTKYDETTEILNQQNHKLERMRFKLIQSKYLDMNEVFKPFQAELSNFSESDYENLKPYILEKDIPTIQDAVHNGILSYENIALFYLYRIQKFESQHNLALHSIITLNPNILKEAREKDRNWFNESNFSLYGLPILIKDNINTIGMATTAGALALQDNLVKDDAFIIEKLKKQGALILGKSNLSEWAYYFCNSCPVGYSAIGGQTLNPYGRKVFETGGSSSGSGVSVAANYAIAALGTETSGSILSPSSKNSVVGLKPTVGLLSRSGIVPISSTLDTPGPMTKSVIDNAIVLNAMIGEDAQDTATIGVNSTKNYLDSLTSSRLKGRRLGVLKPLLENIVYLETVQKLKSAGVEIIEYDPPKIQLEGFRTLLNVDMKNDLPKYLEKDSDPNVKIGSVEEVIQYNLHDLKLRAPYGQGLFEGIVQDSTSTSEMENIKLNLKQAGIEFLKEPLDAYHLDAILSINNYHAGFAAVAQYPCLTVPMGYEVSGEPISLTFIARPFEEGKLLQLGYAFERLTKVRKLPVGFE